MTPLVKYWVEDKYALAKDGPTFANISTPEDAIPVYIAADVEAVLKEIADIADDYENVSDSHLFGYAMIVELLAHLKGTGRKSHREAGAEGGHEHDT
jgi:hypothetical protein